jgi:Thrombospondin type 3 repeat
MSSRTDSRPWLRLLAPLVVAAVVAIAAPAASAAPVWCPNGSQNGGISFFDSADNTWEADSYGHITDGGHDAFDDFAYFDIAATDYDSNNQTYPYQCQLEADGRQLAMPEVNSPITGLTWSRKLYVPETGTPFARWVDFLHNTTAAPIDVPSVNFGGNLGSDNVTAILADADGTNTIADPNVDPWITTWDGFTTADHDAAIAEIWDGTVPGAGDTADHIYTSNNGTTVWAPTQDNLFATYDNVTVPAGATIAFMHVLSVDMSTVAIKERAPLLASGNGGEVFRGLTATELSQIVNWNASDADGDGVANAADNCMTDANGDQADLDKDGTGDVCDNDKDGDGISNTDEAARGTDAAKADSDGDGKADNADVCPAKAGSGDDGCPRFDSVPAPLLVTVDKTAPVVKVKASTKAKRKAFLKGVKASVGCNEACSVVVELVGSVKAAKISRSYNLLLARKTLARATSSRSLTLKPNKKLVGKAKKFTVQLKVTVTDAAGNVSRKTVSVKVS